MFEEVNCPLIELQVLHSFIRNFYFLTFNSLIYIKLPKFYNAKWIYTSSCQFLEGCSMHIP